MQHANLSSKQQTGLIQFTIHSGGSKGIFIFARLSTSKWNCFDTAGLVIWPVKIVPEMTYKVLSGKLNTNQPSKQPTIIALAIQFVHSKVLLTVEPLFKTQFSYMHCTSIQLPEVSCILVPWARTSSPDYLLVSGV